MKENSLSREQIVLQSLVNCAHAILKSTCFKQSAQSVYGTCKDMIGATAGYVALLSEDESLNEILILDMGDLSCSLDPNLPMPIRGFRAKAYSEMDVMFENNFAQSEWVQYLPKGHGQLDNVLFAPLVIAEKAVGVLGFANKPGGFCDDDVFVVKAFAELAAIGLLKNRTLESLQENVNHLDALVQAANDAIVTVDHRGRVISWNKSAESCFGYSFDEIVGQSCVKIIPERYIKAHQEAFAKAVNTGISKLAGQQVEVDALRKDGQIVPVELSMSKWEVEDTVYFTGIIRDISMRRQMEEEKKIIEKRYRDIFKFMKGGGGVYEAVDDGEDFIIVDFWRPDHICSKGNNGNLTDKRILDVFPAIKGFGLLDVFQRVWKTGISEHHPVTIYADGEIIGWRENYVYRLPSGEIAALYEDITEKKQLEIATLESERLFRTIFETSPDAVNINRLHDGKFIIVNQGFLEFTGYAQSEVIGNTAIDIQVWHNLAERDRFFAQILDKKKVKNFEAQFRCKDGSILNAQVSASIFDYHDQPHMLAVTRDITKLKNAEQALLRAHQDLAERFDVTTEKLKKSEIKYSTLVEALLTGVYICSGDKLVFVNKQVAEIFGYHKDEMLNKNILDLIHPKDRDAFRRIQTNALSTKKEESEFEVRGVKKNKDVIYLMGRNTNIDFMGQGAILGNITDITKRKLVEKELLRAQINYRTIADYTYDWEWWANPDGTFRYVSPACERITGYKTDRFVENKRLLREIIVPEDRDQWDKHDNQLNEDVGMRELQFRIMRPDGDVRWIEHACQPVFTRENEFLGFRASNRDITVRKQAEEALQISENNLVKAQEVAHIGSWNLDLLENNLIWTDENYRIFGVSKGTPMTYQKFLEIVHPEDRDYVGKKWSAAIDGEPYDIEHRLFIDNEVKWVREIAELSFDDKGNPISAVGISQDITERKLAEKAMKKSENELQILSALLLSAEEKERKRIARNIHDSVGQALSAIKFSVENSLSFLTEESYQAAGNALNNIIPLTKQTIEEVRRIVMDLRPSMLDDLGLKATISWFCREFESIYTGIHIERTLSFEESDIVVPLKTVIYRIMQEAFNNTAKHSGADYIFLGIEKKSSRLELVIEDNGIGFDVEEVESRVKSGRGVGLASMRERAVLSGGIFDVKSSPGSGTRIHVSWTMTRTPQDREIFPAE